MPASVASSTGTICHPLCSMGGLSAPDRYRRVPAVEIETLVIKSVREHLKLERARLTMAASSTPTLRASRFRRISLVVQLASRHKSPSEGRRKPTTPFTSPGTKRTVKRRREILLPDLHRPTPKCSPDPF